MIDRHLYTAGLPGPDLIIRTSGEVRLSGFLLWQSVHSGFYFTDVNWPAFREIDFPRALRSFQQRARRFGHRSRGDAQAPESPAAPLRGARRAMPREARRWRGELDDRDRPASVDGCARGARFVHGTLHQPRSSAREEDTGPPTSY